VKKSAIKIPVSGLIEDSLLNSTPHRAVAFRIFLFFYCFFGAAGAAAGGGTVGRAVGAAGPLLVVEGGAEPSG
jgi:hypothetical protein